MQIEILKQLKNKNGKQQLRVYHKLTANIDYQNYLKQQVSLIPAEFFGGNPVNLPKLLLEQNKT